MIKTLFRSPVVTAVLFIVAAALLLGGTIGAVQSAPRIQSEDYKAEVVLTNIKTALTERQGGTFLNGKYSGGTFNVVAGNAEIAQERFYKEAGDDTLVLGKTYGEQLSVRNVGTIPQFVRVTVKKYWVTPTANPKATDPKKYKKVDLNPAYIKLGFANTNKWIEDKSARTEEQRVFYYADIVSPGEDTAPFTDTLTIDSAVATDAANKSAEGDYKYKNVEFRIQAQVDAVQTHNADAAMTSAWGRTN